MVNKNSLLLAALCLSFVAKPAFAQESQAQSPSQSQTQWGARDMTYRGENYDVLDTNYISKKKMPQQRKFLNHQYAFPAKPRTMWEVGVGVGAYNVFGNISSQFGYSFNAQVRKSWGYVFSTRLQYSFGEARGIADYKPKPPVGPNDDVWLNAGYAPAVGGVGGDNINPNYKMISHQGNLDFMFNLGNIDFHRARSKASFYGFLGLGVLAYNTKTNLLKSDGTKYTGLTADDFKNEINDNKGGYKTQVKPGKGLDEMTIDPLGSIGAGVLFHLSERVNLQVEERMSVPANNDTWITGVRYDPNSVPGVTNHTYTIINNATVGINVSLGNKKRRVEPLYWINPLDFSYNELSYPRHMILPEPILPDADGDGIADQFDKCPGTPAGVAVDSHGCPMDTDGDGVPDFRDKQLITPTECQPVDADGVGKCPCPDGCGGASAANACGTIGAGSIVFASNSARITSSMQVQLATLSAQMQANPNCKVVITGAGNSNKMEQQRSWDRVNAIIQYMSEKNGISRDRFIFQYGQAGEATTVMYRSAMVGETGGDNPPPPFPNMREKERK